MFIDRSSPFWKTIFFFPLKRYIEQSSIIFTGLKVEMLTNIVKTCGSPLLKVFQTSSRSFFCTQKFSQLGKTQMREIETINSETTKTNTNTAGKQNYKLGNIRSNDYLGLRPIRRCRQEEIGLIEEAYNKLVNEGQLTTEDSQINWYSVYMNRDLTVPKNDFWIRFHSTVQKIFYETERKEETIFSYGFLVNPANSQKDQFYHFDYAGETGNLFISMVYHTTENSTQYLKDFVPEAKPDLGPRNYNCYGYNDIELLEKEDADFLEVSQIICRPYVIMKGGKRTIHRGIKNRTKTARPIFYLNFGNHNYTVNEPARHSFQEQVRWRESLQKEGNYQDYYKE